MAALYIISPSVRYSYLVNEHLPMNSLSVLITLSQLMNLARNIPGNFENLDLLSNQCKTFQKVIQNTVAHVCGKLSVGQIFLSAPSRLTPQYPWCTRHSSWAKAKPWNSDCPARGPTSHKGCTQVGGASLAFSMILNPR